MEAKGTVMNYEKAISISTYREQLERFAGEDGMKLWWVELEKFLLEQAKISFKAGYEAAEEELGKCYAPTFQDGKKAGIKEVVEWGRESCSHDLVGEGTHYCKRACD